MVVSKLVALVWTLNLGGVLAGSVTSCGGPGDLLSDVQITLTPDPMQKGRSFTMDVSGMLGDELMEGNVEVNLDVKALKVIDEKVAKSASFHVSPGLAKGPQRLVVGPVTLPELPGAVVVSGKVHFTDKAGAPVACIALDLNVPASAAEVVEFPQALSREDLVVKVQQQLSNLGSTLGSLSLQKPSQHLVPVRDVSNCAKASDHLKDLKVENSGGMTNITGTLDEELTKISADVDLKLEVSILHYPVKLTVPISYAPGIPKGPFAMSFGPAKALAEQKPVAWPKPKVSIEGTVKVNDANSEEVACMQITKDDSVGHAESVLV